MPTPERQARDADEHRPCSYATVSNPRCPRRDPTRPLFGHPGCGRSQSGTPTKATPNGHHRRAGVNFVTLATGAALVLALLNFLPAMALGPLVEGLL
ncbi:potassium-transporting ATPase subunit KdpA [Kitasatospora sp. NPDC004669]|uniref:potassium-transporting ATPase subunit KdpA n=1 Tax=Kitasatospora sp. NPDC004669 TaxID=3154555 RepID=UPI0033A4D730